MSSNSADFSGTAEAPEGKMPPLLLSGALMGQRQVNAQFTMGIINKQLGTNFGK
jgi:hypothetical protein